MIKELAIVLFSISTIGVVLSSELFMGGLACRLSIEPDCTIWSSAFNIFFTVLILCLIILIYLGLKELRDSKKF